MTYKRFKEFNNTNNNRTTTIDGLVVVLMVLIVAGGKCLLSKSKYECVFLRGREGW